MMSLKTEFEKGDRAPRSKSSRYYEYDILKARQDNDITLMRKLMAERSMHPSIDFGSEDHKKLSYVRYADD